MNPTIIGTFNSDNFTKYITDSKIKYDVLETEAISIYSSSLMKDILIQINDVLKRGVYTIFPEQFTWREIEHNDHANVDKITNSIILNGRDPDFIKAL